MPSASPTTHPAPAPANRYALAAAAVRAYEARKVASIFRPLAEATMAAIKINANDDVLDVACGTVIIARTIRRQFAHSIRLTGVDLNDQMVVAARNLTRQLPGRFDWTVADVARMPFAARRFTHCFCQQGIQYFPDEAVALAEIGRVLADRGMLVHTVWSAPNDYFLAQSAALTKHVDAETGQKALAPFTYSGIDQLPDWLQQAGFGNIATGAISITRVITDAVNGIAEDIAGSPLEAAVSARGPAALAAVCRDILTDCAGYMREGNLIIEQHAHLITATTNDRHVR